MLCWRCKKGEDTHGGIKDKSTLEPEPALLGLTSVISVVMQPSPLYLQSPMRIRVSPLSPGAANAKVAYRSVDT